MNEISIKEWGAYSAPQRARIGAAYLLDMKRNRIRDCMSNDPNLAQPALAEMLALWERLIHAHAWPVLWTKAQCDRALTMPWQAAMTPFGGYYFAMRAERRRALEIEGTEFFKRHLPSVNPNDLLFGKV